VAGSIPVSRSHLRSPDTRASYGGQAKGGSPIVEVLHEGCRRLRGALRRGRSADLSAVAPFSEGSGAKADVAQLAERVLGKDEVTSSILVIGSSLRSASQRLRRL